MSRPLPDFHIATLDSDLDDYGMRPGDRYYMADGTMYRIVLIISPRKVVIRPPQLWDHVWVHFARWRDEILYGVQRPPQQQTGRTIRR